MDSLFFSLIAIALLGTASSVFFVKKLMNDAKNENLIEKPFSKKFGFADIEKYRFLIANIALSLSILLVLTAFEWKSFEDIKLPVIISEVNSESSIELTHITKQEPPKPQKIMVQPEIKIVKDDKIIEKIETIFEPEKVQEQPTNTFVREEPIIEAEEIEDITFVVVEESAEPEGGMEAFVKYLQKSLKYPKQAKKLDIEGRVFVQFVVGKDGSISEVKAIKGIGGGCDEEAVRVLEAAPKWKAGKQRGRAVKQRVVVPIVFHLSK